jgi:hypothetical protein
MRYRFLFLLITISVAGVMVFIAKQTTRKSREIRSRLASALLAQDASAIANSVAEMNGHLGENAGTPEKPDKYIAIPSKSKWLNVEEAKKAVEPFVERIEQLRWWAIGLDPTKLEHALREPAAVVSGCLAIHRAELIASERSLELAMEAGDFLVWAQKQGGSGVFPFPASRGLSRSAEFAAAERQLRQAEQAGNLGNLVSNGWAVDDQEDGGLQFDNGESGVAIIELFESTNDRRYLDSARWAADWAVSRPLVANWNYNSFSVSFLARIYRTTGEQKYLDSATSKAILGVIPGQLREGDHIGRWNDAHNALPVYHYILLRSLAELAYTLPKDEVHRPSILESLRIGLIARNKDFLGKGASNKDKAIELLLFVNSAFADDQDFLRETMSRDALEALGKLVSEQARRGNYPLGPRGWGHFLECANFPNR